eukprot:6760211-Alexandrium_andersonii.AAC.1
MSASLVGSEMCIRDSDAVLRQRPPEFPKKAEYEFMSLVEPHPGMSFLSLPFRPASSPHPKHRTM